MAVGHAKNKIFIQKAKGLNKSVVYVGSKTGRDGMHALGASAEFNENSEENQQFKWRSFYRETFIRGLFRANER